MTMKYFTPERWLRFQDPRDKQVFFSAHEEWQEALRTYRRKLRQILRRSPNRLKRFAESECLHDAMVLAIWQGRSRLNVILRPDMPTQEVVVLTYTLLADPLIDPSALPPEYRTKHAAWMYDEIGTEKRENGKMVFTHTVLLSNGWQVAIRFSRFDFARRKVLLLDSKQQSMLSMVGKPSSAREA
jgi:hypothetical protein